MENYIHNHPYGVYNFSRIKRRWHLMLDIIQAHRRAILGGIADSVGECYLVRLGTGA
jgi:hypothetical protein